MSYLNFYIRNSKQMARCKYGILVWPLGRGSSGRHAHPRCKLPVSHHYHHPCPIASWQTLPMAASNAWRNVVCLQGAQYFISLCIRGRQWRWVIQEVAFRNYFLLYETASQSDVATKLPILRGSPLCGQAALGSYQKPSCMASFSYMSKATSRSSFPLGRGGGSQHRRHLRLAPGAFATLATPWSATATRL